MDLKQARDILEVGMGATHGDIRRAYRLQVRRWHPDRFVDDPAGRLRAEELLKAINEAYALLQVEEAGHSQPPPTESPVTRTAAPAAEPVHADPGPRSRKRKRPEPVSLFEALPTFPIIAFFAAWQNLAFVLLAVCTVSVSLQLYGTFFGGAGYLLRMLAIPCVFALLCNVVYCKNRLLWGMYVATVSIVGGVLMLDSVRFGNDRHEAAFYNSSTSPDGGGGLMYGRGGTVEPEQGSFSFPGRRASSGPLPPVPPDVVSPSAPLAPAAPLAPLVPAAPPAR